MDPLNDKITCPLCPRACRLDEGGIGFCRARIRRGGKIILRAPGELASLALDPIEKKPLARFRPGSMILSAGFFGCNMRCPFCQNYQISMAEPDEAGGRRFSPEELVGAALGLKARGNCGLAFTYNEPLIAFEFVEETFRLAKAEGLETVLVTNGNFMPEPIRRIAPLVSAWNIDLKCFTEEGYRRLGGSLSHVKKTIELASEASHVEVTTLLVPGLSDGEEDMRREAEWLASVDPDMTLHLSRYFPCYKKREGGPTSRDVMKRLEKIAREQLKYVKLGNI